MEMKVLYLIVSLTALCSCSLAQGVQRCTFVTYRTKSQWTKDVYRQGEDICPVKCCGTYGSYGITLGCIPWTRRLDFTAYKCCDEEIERVKVNGKYVCASTSPTTNLTKVEEFEFIRPEGYPGLKCPSEFITAYPTGFTDEDFADDLEELCHKDCYWKTGQVKPPYHYYRFKDCCANFKKYLNSEGKYVCIRSTSD